MSDTVWLFLGLALAISFAGDRITYAIKGTPPGGLKPWAETIGRVLGGVIGSVPGVFLGNPYITGVGGLLGIEIGPAIFSFVFPAPKKSPVDRIKSNPRLMNFTGEELLSMLTNGDETRTKLGESYIYGVYDGLATAAVAAKADLLFAMPREWSLEQLRNAVVSSLQQHPEQLQQPASLSVHNSLILAFPKAR